MTKYEILGSSFLFLGVDSETLEGILKTHPPTILSFKRGDLIYSSQSERRLCGFVLSGKCEVRLDRPDGSKTLLNTIDRGGSFGILSIYSSDQFPTQIYAARNTEVLFFNASQIEYFVNNYSQISSNLIKFLAQRISFLNKKIVTFSGVKVEDRLSAFLLLEREKQGGDSFRFNVQKTSEEINAGRASVYRAISSLEEANLIKLTDKQITILDPQGLERK